MNRSMIWPNSILSPPTASTMLSTLRAKPDCGHQSSSKSLSHCRRGHDARGPPPPTCNPRTRKSIIMSSLRGSRCDSQVPSGLDSEHVAQAARPKTGRPNFKTPGGEVCIHIVYQLYWSSKWHLSRHYCSLLVSILIPQWRQQLIRYQVLCPPVVMTIPRKGNVSLHSGGWLSLCPLSKLFHHL